MVAQPLPKKMRVMQQEMTDEDTALINALHASHSNPDVFKAFTSIKQTRAAGEGMMSGLLQKTSDPDAAFDRAVSAVLSAIGMKQVGVRQCGSATKCDGDTNKHIRLPYQTG
jgi:hypothetical protein